MGKRRLEELDALRGLAAFAVLVYHLFLAADVLHGTFKDILMATPLQAMARGRQAVIFFFVLSGFVLTRALGDRPLTLRRYRAWCAQRSIRLLVPTLASLLISVTLYALVSKGKWSGEADWLTTFTWNVYPSAGSFLAQAALINPTDHYNLNQVLWTLAYEWRISLLLPLLVAFSALAGKRSWMALVLIGVFAHLESLGSVGDVDLSAALPHAIWCTSYFVTPFCIAAALARANVITTSVSGLTQAIALIAVVSLMRVGQDVTDYGASVLLIWVATQPNALRAVLQHRAMRTLGDLSFSLYLSHGLLLTALFHGLHGVLPTGVLVALTFALALPVAYVFHLVAERPSHHLARWVGRRLNAAPACEVSQIEAAVA